MTTNNVDRFDEISRTVRAQWREANPKDYEECIRRIRDVVYDYGELGVLAMMAVIEGQKAPTLQELNHQLQLRKLLGAMDSENRKGVR